MIVLALVGLLATTAAPALATTPGEPGRIAYLRYQGEDPGQLVTVDEAATDFKPVVVAENYGAGPSGADYSPDGRWLAYLDVWGGSLEPSYEMRLVRTDGTGDLLWLMEADGSRQRRIPNTGERDNAARFSADGQQIVFTRWRDGHEHFATAELYRIGVDGTGLTGMTSVPDGVSHIAASWQSLPAYTAQACPEGEVPTAGFDDVSGTHAASVDCAVWHDLASGRDVDTYAPTMPVRRDQIATFLVRVVDRLVQEGHVELPG